MNSDPKLLRQYPLLTAPWILYDGTCSICTQGATCFGPMLRRRGFRLATLQSTLAQTILPSMLDDEMKVVTHTGTILGGAQAICHLAGKVWWASPLALLWHLHFPRPLLRKLYRHIADRRHCKNGNCSLRPPTHNRGSLTRVFNCL